jgi:hypothetical protein
MRVQWNDALHGHSRYTLAPTVGPRTNLKSAGQNNPDIKTLEPVQEVEGTIADNLGVVTVLNAFPCLSGCLPTERLR